MTQLKFISKEPINKGWSCDKKYCAAAADGTKYFLRVTPDEKSANREDMFHMQQKAAVLGVPMGEPVEFGKCENGVYIAEKWINGQDAGEVIPYLPDSQQYAYGLSAGRILKIIHSISAPKTQPDWESRFNAKIDRKIKMYHECPIQLDGAENIINYIEANRSLLAGRPQTFQHGDYHIGNMMMEKDKIIIVDFDRFDFGDPWEEFNRIVWCAQASPLFASGMVNGYFDNQVPDLFWRLLALYIGSNTLSSISWAVPFGEGEINTMLHQAKQVLDWYDNMRNPVPAWYFRGYYLQYIDGLPYKMKSEYDFSFISNYGRVFKVFDDQDSGNICFGIEKEKQKFFIKYAGAPTEPYNGTAEQAIERLKSTLPIYSDLRHPNLIELVEAGEISDGFFMLFQWADGDCMGRMYPQAHLRFMNLSAEARLAVFDDVLNFLEFVHLRGYMALDFYDGSIIYDFESGKTTICDIDLFRKKPCRNDMGRMWGSSKFMSPEEFKLGAQLDEVTNVYTAGAIAFALFGEYERTREKWELSEALFKAAAKAVSDEREARQQSIRQFIEEWKAAI